MSDFFPFSTWEATGRKEGHWREGVTLGKSLEPPSP